MIYTALPVISREFGGVRSNRVANFCFCARPGCEQLPSAAVFGDIYGKRRTILALLVFCGVGSAISAAASGLSSVIVGRLSRVYPARSCHCVMALLARACRANGWRWRSDSCLVDIPLARLSVTRWAGCSPNHWMACDFLVTALAPILLVPVILMVLPRSEALQGGTTRRLVGGILFAPRRRRLAWCR